jgi:hypothetical protein
MYCSSCGIDSVEGLKYCKRCGVNLTAPLEATQPKTLPFGLITAVLIFIGAVFLTGLLIPLVITKELNGFSQRDMMTLFVIEFGVTLAVVAMLVWFLFRLIGVNKQSDGPARAVDVRRSELAAPQDTAPRQPIMSVTENTTRSFEPSFYEHSSK